MHFRIVRLKASKLSPILVLLIFTAAVMPRGGYRVTSAGPLATPPFTARDASQFDAEVPIAWFDLAYALVRDEGFSPPAAARIFGYLGVALYEALVPGMPGYQSLAGQLNDLQTLPKSADPAYHWPTVANSALAATLSQLLNTESSSTQAAIQTLEEQFVREFKSDLPPGVYRRSVERGQSISQAILRWAASDGYESYKDCPYLPPIGAGLWQPTPPGFRPPLLPCWGKLRPFVLTDGSECSSGPPPVYSEDPESEFYQQAWEVYSVINDLTPEQLAIVQFWADNPGQTGTPPGHSISVLNQILRQQGLSLQTGAEAYARVGIAVADSFIACWQAKYQYNLLRPITYIHTVIGDSGWSTPVVTPPFPEYTSGHSVQSAAAAQVLTAMFGEVVFTDNTHASLGYAPRIFTSFFAFAEEAAISRLYGGIHFRVAIERGLEQGRCIGQRVNGLDFRNVNQP
jgi:hypothetical protein